MSARDPSSAPQRLVEPPIDQQGAVPGAATFGCAARRAAAGGRARQAAAAAAAGPWGRGGGRRSDSPRCAAKRSGQSGSGGRAPTQLGAEHVRQGERLGRALGRAGAGEVSGEEERGRERGGAVREEPGCGLCAGRGPPRRPPRRPPPGSCRLALYVYEYLLHVGAQKSAQTFLSEVSPHRRPLCSAAASRPPSCAGRASGGGRRGPPRSSEPRSPLAAPSFRPQIRWEKNITLGEPPGFLHSWWW